MNMLLYGIKNIMRNNGPTWLLAIFMAAALTIAMSHLFPYFVSAQEKKADAKPVPGEGAPAASLEEERLKILRADILKQIDELKRLKQELEEQRKGVEGKKQEQLIKVVKMYEAMQPEEAAKAIEKLDDDTAVKILTTLKPRSAGKVLAQIDPARAAVLSKKALKGK